CAAGLLVGERTWVRGRQRRCTEIVFAACSSAIRIALPAEKYANTCTCPWQIHPIIQRGETMPSKIEDYGLIGNTFTGALVSRSGSIDWLCAPRFDSDACFAAIIGYDQ